jgi:hypothetical protein
MNQEERKILIAELVESMTVHQAEAKRLLAEIRVQGDCHGRTDAAIKNLALGMGHPTGRFQVPSFVSVERLREMVERLAFCNRTVSEARKNLGELGVEL